MNNERNRSWAYGETPRKCGNALSVGICRADFAHGLVTEFRRMVKHSLLNAKIAVVRFSAQETVTMKKILGPRNQFKICQMIVLTISIFVIDFLRSWNWALERLIDKAMNIKLLRYSISTGIELCISSAVGLEDSTEAVSHAPQVTCFINGFIARNGLPSFCHACILA